MDDYLITLDVDWASDYMIFEAAEYLIKAGVKATWFITHNSSEIIKLFDHPELFEVGIHPNFCVGSTQGDSPSEIMENLLKIVPNSSSMRTHALMQSSHLLKMARMDFGILNDVSLHLQDTHGIVPHAFYVSKNVPVFRFPYFWEDDTEMNKPSPQFFLTPEKHHNFGLKIFDFHPVHLSLNSSSMDDYNQIRQKIDITKCSASEYRKYVNYNAAGAGTFFKELIEFIQKSNKYPGLTISELSLKWRTCYESSSHR